MKAADIQSLIAGAPPGSQPQLMETHISWVLLQGAFAYKIKKPVRFDFLDSASLTRRHFLCQEEVRLNRRLAPDLYLGVVPVRQAGGTWSLEGASGEIADYAVKMHRLDPARQLDACLAAGTARPAHLHQLGLQHRTFFETAEVIPYQPGHTPLGHAVQGLGHVTPYLRQALGVEAVAQAEASAGVAAAWQVDLRPLMRQRQAAGWVRDLHGDLHSANIFLYDPPLVFDCLEFAPDLRRIDLLDEAAFLGMDLCAHGQPALEEAFLQGLLGQDYPLAPGLDRLYHFFKWYRAMIRAKVQALQARLAPDQQAEALHLRACARYLALMYAFSHPGAAALRHR